MVVLIVQVLQVEAVVPQEMEEQVVHLQEMVVLD